MTLATILDGHSDLVTILLAILLLVLIVVIGKIIQVVISKA